MIKKKPLVSILMNCFNGEKFVKEAIECVLSQSYKNWELILWDNQSTDNSANIFKSFKDKRLKYYYSSKHTHLGGGRARAYPKLKGELIAIIDTDDIWFPSKLIKQVNEFTDKEIGLVISNAYKFTENKKKPLFGKNIPKSGYVFNDLLNDYFVCLPTLIFRRSFVEKLNISFDPDFNYISDFDLVMRLSSISKLKYIDEILAGWRLHGQNASLKKPFLFLEEKEIWINKILNNETYIFKNYPVSISKFKKNLLRQKALFLLFENKRIDAFKLILKTKCRSIKDLFVFCLIISQISSKILKKMYLKKISNI